MPLKLGTSNETPQGSLTERIDRMPEAEIKKIGQTLNRAEFRLSIVYRLMM